MIIYILKFSACLAIFMLFYKLLLEKSSVHKFKRFYLLGALVLALIIPSLTLIEYVEPVAAEQLTTFVVPNFDMVETTPEVIEVNYTPIILWSLYGLGVLIFLLKFCFNLNNIISRIRSNPKLKSGSFINVLVSNLKIPHTFFNYIFFNKYKFELGEIPKEVFLHEQTHAKQKHSIDVLILEILQILFWFNPLIYLLKRDIKLNHEYLADQAVLKNGIKPSTYQTILLAFSSNAQHQELANAINYSSIKKRFTVMNTHTSKTSIWLRSLLILPVLAVLLYGFTEREFVEREIIVPIDLIELYLNEEGELTQDEEIITMEDLEKLFEQDNDLNVSIKIYPDAPQEIQDNIFEDLRAIGIKKIKICTSQEAAFIDNNSQTEATPEQLAEYNKLAKKYNKQPQDKRIIKRIDIERLEYLYKIMNDEQKKNAEPFPDCPPPPPAPPILSSSQLNEYNKLAKKYNDQPLEQRIIKLKDYNYLESLYQSMSEEQKENSQAFPSFPTPPPPPPPPAPPIKVSKYKYTWILLNSKGQFLVNDELASLESIEKEFVKINKTKSKDIVFKHDEEAPKELLDKVNLLIEKYKLENIIDTLPPPPPPPVSPLDFVIDMAKKNATFFYENEKITSDKAISLLKQNPDLNILAKDIKKKNPLVYISIKPISIQKK